MTSALPPTRRVDLRNGHRYLMDGEVVPGVTSILDKGFPKPALVGWAANVTADYATDNWDDLAAMKPSERTAVLKRARWEARDAAARRGTEVHDLAQRWLAGEEVAVPEELDGHVRAFARFVEEWDVREWMTEAVCLNRTLGYMGTLDAIAELADGNVWLLDWKTNLKGPFPETALQLAAYRNAEYVLDANGVEQAMPRVDRTGVVWVRDGEYDLLPFDTSAPIFATFLYVRQVAEFVARDRESVIGSPLAVPTGAEVS